MQSATQAKPHGSSWEWMWLALISHTAWGIYPVLARYLQKVSGLPSMALLTIANLASLLLIAVVVIRRGELRTLAALVIWGVAVLAMIRSVTNVVSTRYAPASYVQLANLLTPFLVVGLGAAVYREPIPPRTGIALGLSLIGALAMLSGSMSVGTLQFALQGSEWLGVGLAMVSSLSLALYMLAVRSTAQSRASAEATFAVQLIVITTSTAVLSGIFQEDWSHWLSIGSGDWAVFVAFTLVVLGANMTQINAIRRLGAPLVSSLQAWRLVATLLGSGLILSEWLSTPIQLLGAVIVVSTVSWYLWSQRVR